MAELAADNYDYIAKRLREIRGEPPLPSEAAAVAATPPESKTQIDEEDEAWAAYLMSGAY